MSKNTKDLVGKIKLTSVDELFGLSSDSDVEHIDAIKDIDVNLIDGYEFNNEDVSMIDDLLIAMKQNGYTDPIEVTDYGCEDGRYMILSGHRRYAAWTTLYKSEKPIKCIVVNKSKFEDVAADAVFNTPELAIENYVRMANAQRTTLDPYVLMNRYRDHEALLQKANFTGNIRKEVAARLGLSVKQADRYKALGKCIEEIQLLVKDEVIGMSVAEKFAPFTESEQKKIYQIIKDAIADNVTVTRNLATDISKYFKMELWTWNAIKEQLRDDRLADSSPINTSSGNVVDDKDVDRNNEVRREFDPIAANADAEDQARNEYEKSLNEEDSFENNEELTKEKKNANNLIRTIKKLDNSLLNDFFEFEDEEVVVAMAEETIGYIKEYIINRYKK